MDTNGRPTGKFLRSLWMKTKLRSSESNYKFRFCTLKNEKRKIRKERKSSSRDQLRGRMKLWLKFWEGKKKTDGGGLNYNEITCCFDVTRPVANVKMKSGVEQRTGRRTHKFHVQISSRTYDGVGKFSHSAKRTYHGTRFVYAVVNSNIIVRTMLRTWIEEKSFF